MWQYRLSIVAQMHSPISAAIVRNRSRSAPPSVPIVRTMAALWPWLAPVSWPADAIVQPGLVSIKPRDIDDRNQSRNMEKPRWTMIDRKTQTYARDRCITEVSGLSGKHCSVSLIKTYQI